MAKIRRRLGGMKRRLALALMGNRERELLSYLDGYLRGIGWIASYDMEVPVGPAGEALPWVTYPFIDFIADRIGKGFRIFEYGCGNSTVFYALRALSVTSVEHDRAWYEKVGKTAPENVELIFREMTVGGEYCRTAAGTGGKFDIIIVDGRDRVNCIKNSLEALEGGGVIVLDDSERERYIEGVGFLGANGFRRIDFWGIPPGLFYRKCTSVFYRDNNCLGI